MQFEIPQFCKEVPGIQNSKFVMQAIVYENPNILISK